MPSLSFGLLAAPLLSGLFSTATALPSRRPLPVSVRAAFTRSGCFTDTDAGNRALSGDFLGDDSMTVEVCAEYCSTYQFFGIEYGRECYCSNERNANSLAVPDADCNFACPGDASQTCGAGSRLEIYTNDNYAPPSPPAVVGAPYLGCFVDNGARVLPDRIISEDDMTAAKCAANCKGYAYFGTQWSRECYCGNAEPTEATPASDCNMPCSGDATELCGAGMRLSVYGSVGTTTPPVVDPAATNPTAVGDYAYDGCYTDSIALRVLSGETISRDDMTLESCATICAGYPYFGVEYGIQCFCGTDLNASTRAPESECTMHCPGDGALICGDANRLTVYKKPTAPAAPSSPAEAGSFKYQSCWADSVGERSLLGGPSEARAEMTVETCAAFCEGYAFFGVEYSTECYCGNELAGQASSEADCSMLCAGNAEQWCGGPNRFNLYAVNPWDPSSTTTLPESTTAAVPETTSSEAASSTDAAETTTSEAATFTEETPEPTSTAPQSTEVPEETSIAATSTGASSTEGVPSTTFLPPTSSLAEQTPTITTPAQLTTVTSCGSPTIVPGQTRCYGKLPEVCNILTATDVSDLEGDYGMYYDACTMFMYPMPTQVTSCLPDGVNNLEDGLRAYSCMSSGLMCSSSSKCATATYTVGQEPATTPPAPAFTPAPSNAVVANGGFETGTKSGWAFSDLFLPFNTDEISTLRAHSGKYATRRSYP
ncbi:WSC domain-containing protein [Staphylotrichum tortipilum]|uniref:WSC domain-containing protein n=1 Tax=Staphylotrichum tortipilum TaxID=2831512 RepID=A0AAN6MFC9_9PEZI|nr:WSC domain-containing protein [Staphylotrichum longicolle]